MYANIVNAPAPSAHIIDYKGYGYANGLSDEQLQHSAPSIFADDRHESRSERYEFVSTRVLLSGMRSEGFLPVKVVQSKSRTKDKQGHTKHQIRFRRIDQLAAPEALELALTNSHDGSCALQLDKAITRLVCSNGLMVCNNESSIRIRHGKDAMARTIEGAYSIINNFSNEVALIEQAKSITLDTGHQVALAKAALTLRYDETKEIDATPFLRARRTEDLNHDGKRDLWTVYNVLQENIIKGGVRAKSIDALGKVDYRKAREIKGIDQSNAINRALWVLMPETAKLNA